MRDNRSLTKENFMNHDDRRALGVALEKIRTALEKMGFKIYMTYGTDNLKEIAFHIELKSITSENTNRLVCFLGHFNFGAQPEEDIGSSWVLFPHNYGGMDIYLSLQPHRKTSLQETLLFGNMIEDFYKN